MTRDSSTSTPDQDDYKSCSFREAQRLVGLYRGAGLDAYVPKDGHGPVIRISEKEEGEMEEEELADVTLLVQIINGECPTPDEWRRIKKAFLLLRRKDRERMEGLPQCGRILEGTIEGACQSPNEGKVQLLVEVDRDVGNSDDYDGMQRVRLVEVRDGS